MEDLIASLEGEYSKTSKDRLRGMARELFRIDRENIAGDVVECGVWRGGNIILARMLSPLRVCWLYDTFTGMPEPGDLDTKKSGAKAITSYRHKMGEGRRWAEVSADEVRGHLDKFGVLDDRYLRFVEGMVETTLMEAKNVPDLIALLRLDTDWYASTKVELEVLYPLLAPGGSLIIDDYGHWMGARKAVDDYFSGAGIKISMIDYSAALVIKPC